MYSEIELIAMKNCAAAKAQTVGERTLIKRRITVHARLGTHYQKIAKSWLSKHEALSRALSKRVFFLDVYNSSRRILK